MCHILNYPSATAVANFCHRRGKLLPPPWQTSATAVAQKCPRRGTKVPTPWHKSAPAWAQVCLAVGTLFSLPVAAQQQARDTTLNRTVVVEQEYNPDIRDADKVNVLPRIETPTVSRRAAEYDLTLMPTADIPASTVAIVPNPEALPRTPHGYARLGYGNRGNLDAAAGYLFTPSRRDRVGIHFGMTGMNGRLGCFYGPDRKWDARYYRTRADIGYAHGFDKAELSIKADFDLHNFNYPPYRSYGINDVYSPIPYPNTLVYDRQKFMGGGLTAGIQSTDRTLPLQYHLDAGYRLFQRKHFYASDNTVERLASVKAGALGSITEEQHIGLDVSFDYYSYNRDDLKGYALLRALPYYRLHNDDWSIKLGAHVDYTIGFDAGLRVSPDVSIQYTFADSYVVYAQAGGGTIVNDFRRLAELHPYADQPSNPLTGRLRNTHERINTSLGIKASPVDGLWFNVYGGYQRLKDDMATTMAHDGEVTPSNPLSLLDTKSMLTVLNISPSNLYAGAEVRYNYKDIFSLTVNGVYRSWKSDYGYNDNIHNITYANMLCLKPEFEGHLRAAYRPIAPLQVYAGMYYITRPEKSAVMNGHFAPVNDLYAGADYDLLPAVTLYARVNNLLNKQYLVEYGIYSQRFHFLGGIRFRF